MANPWITGPAADLPGRVFLMGLPIERAIEEPEEQAAPPVMLIQKRQKKPIKRVRSVERQREYARRYYIRNRESILAANAAKRAAMRIPKFTELET
jgi:hypothetical protein